MLFSSLNFLFIFFPLILGFYFISDRKIKNYVLLVFSFFFYFYGGPKYFIIMIISILGNYIFGLLADKYREDKKKIRWILFFTVILNISFLVYYKYTNFLLENLGQFIGVTIPGLQIVMPIGISFYTFQGLCYVIDVYRQDGKVQKNPLKVALYISLFPQLIAGPIVRYQTVAEQIDHRTESVDKFAHGLERFILGLSKKILISNSMGLIADQIFAIPIGELNTTLAWVGAIAYTMQIYFDFSGYSDMAIGLGRIFGFEFLENFNYPYISKSITDFWRRWHISLSTWFRDYIYIPLGGNRVGKWKQLRNIFLVWMLTGLWHGASWNFVAWGLYFGILLTIEKFIIGKRIDKVPSFIRHVYAMVLVIFGWVLFRAVNLTQAYEYILVMLGNTKNQAWDNRTFYYLIEYKWEFILAIIFSMPVYPYLISRIENIKNKSRVVLRYCLVPVGLMGMFVVNVLYLINSTYNPFIYFRF